MDMKKHFERSMLNLLKEKCVDQITINELIQEVGSCKSTFYKYYVDKYDLCNKCLANNIYNQINFNESDWEKFLFNYIDVIGKNAKLIVNAFASTDISAPIFQGQRMIFDVLSRSLRAHGVDVEDETMGFVLHSCSVGLINIVNTWLKQGRTEDMQKFVQRIRNVTPKSIYAYIYQDE